jgi:hypothetical protein
MRTVQIHCDNCPAYFVGHYGTKQDTQANQTRQASGIL